MCPNYLCKKVFKDAKAYLKHAGDCEPFYYCEKCTGTYKSFRGYTGHNCPGKPVKVRERLGLDGAICMADSFEFTIYHCIWY